MKSRGGWYHGSFENGTKHGHGKMQFNSGATYDGEWEGNRMVGEGTYIWPDNRRYDGEGGEPNLEPAPLLTHNPNLPPTPNPAPDSPLRLILTLTLNL